MLLLVFYIGGRYGCYMYSVTNRRGYLAMSSLDMLNV